MVIGTLRVIFGNSGQQLTLISSLAETYIHPINREINLMGMYSRLG